MGSGKPLVRVSIPTRVLARAAFWRSLRSGWKGDALLYLVPTRRPGWAIRRLRRAGEARPVVSGNG